MPSWTKEQLSAINEEGKNIIVSAGAGSGKTAVLSERVLRKLKSGVNIDELLILTFTKAAAKEMKERIRKKIKKDELLKEQLDLIDASYITTFDSFALSTVKKYYYTLNLSPNISVIDSSLIKLEKEKIINEIFEEKYINEDKKFEKLISDFCIRDDKEIKKYILLINEKLDLKSNKTEYLNKYLENNFNDIKIKKDISDFEKLLLNKINNINDVLQELSFITDGEWFYKLKDSFEGLLNSKSYNEIINNLNITMPKLPRGSEDDVKKLKNSLTDELNNIKSLCKYSNINEIYDQIISTKEYVECIIDIIHKLDKKISEYKYKNDMFEFNDIAILAIKILKENKDVRDELRYKFNEIMIDEYQDTNDIQEEFISLISNNNVYMVGDIKQSIYRFRNANPYIFKNKYDKYKDNIDGLKIDLNKNFRSRKEVLFDINVMFELLMDDILGGAEYKISHKMIFGNNSYDELGSTNQNNDLEIYNYEYDRTQMFSKEEIEAFIIAYDIKNKIDSNYKVFDKDEGIIRNVEYNDFVVLMDKSSNFNLYRKIFEYVGVPLTIDKDENITEDIVLSLLKNLLLFILKVHNLQFDTEFKYLFISIQRSPLYEMDDNSIFEMFKENNFKENNLYTKAKNISNNIDNMSIKDFIKYVIDEFDFYENIIKMGNVNANIVKIEYILNSIDSFSKMGYTINDFTYYLKDIIDNQYDIKFNSNNESSNSVKIMTIHKSKGLEYHICYYSGLYSRFNISDLNDKFIFDNKYGLITPSFNEGIDTTIYKELLKDDYIKEEISEKIRLFYVALTRAKEKMILVVDLNSDDDYMKKENGVINDNQRIKYRSFRDMLLSIKQYINKYIVKIELEKLNITKKYNLIKNSNYTDYIGNETKKLDIKEIKIENEIKKEQSYSKKVHELIDKTKNNNIKLGLDMHYAFEIIDFNNPNIDDIDISDFCKNKIKSFLDNKLFDNISDSKIYKEYEFMYEFDNNIFHGIIDLMLVYDDHIDIVDYKLKNINDDNYIKQLNGYKKYIENKLRKETNIYLYSIMDEKIKKVGDIYE